MPKKAMHPLVAQALQHVAEVGKKALGRAFDSVLEDASQAAAHVQSRATQARSRVDQAVDETVGVGRPKKKRRVKKSRAKTRRRVVGEDEESE